ncbi:NAD(P)/FAD-dependent oxidoreductase [Stenotrophomonas tumulicola]|uniref:FAD-dependent oxidoreductase n=1 Tax=Stenotrophomonas tumulicola TaxID=1685415 RepID=A0A7W3FNB5_9GAMM|nr:FAD-dependent oxidoreductase [Stenotrophomonas tumulicola]MBA8682734.1 FAD-dependent oxidoreductase [Stenotrophomonas tumulicola]
MQQNVERIVIAGAGQAGASAAIELRRAGFQGGLVLVGDEVHAPYERPQLSKEMLKPGEVTLRAMREEDVYETFSIQLALGTKATHVDAERRRLVMEDGTHHDYDRLLLATGVRPRSLPDADARRVRYLRTVEDALQLREDIEQGHSIAVVGGGVIGLEVAAAVNARGNPVVVIEAGQRLMMRSVDERIARYLDRTHRGRGVDIRYGTQITSWDASGMLTLSDGSRIQADRVLVGIGVVPNTELVAHLDITDELGVRVDACGRTALRDIYATGDVASQPGAGGFARVETWANAQDHAAAVARSLMGDASPYQSPTWFWSDQGMTNLQVLGNAMQGTPVLRGDEHGDRFSIFWLDTADRLTGCSAVNSPKDMAMARRWIRQSAVLEPRLLADLSHPLRDCLALAGATTEEI